MITDEFPYKDIRSSLLRFLNNQQDKNIPGYYAYSYSGDLFDSNRSTNIAGSIFALKLLHMLGETDKQIITPIIDRILTFQKPNGSIYDPFIFRKSFSRNFLSSFAHGQFNNLDNHQYVRAETRQAYSSLLLYKVIPKTIYTDIPTTSDGIKKYLQALDWTRPWGAGSHFSHLMFFLSLLHQGGNMSTETFESAKESALHELASFYHKKDGAWYTGNPSLLQKINGSMKILTGMLWIDSQLPNPKRLIDLCLSHNEPVHACDQFNKTMVLRYADEATNHTYRRDEIETWCHSALLDWQAYYHPKQGGFSFWKGRANERYYGARITRGLNEADMHGTVLFIWGLSMMAKLIPSPELSWLKEMKS